MLCVFLTAATRRNPLTRPPKHGALNFNPICCVRRGSPLGSVQLGVFALLNCSVWNWSISYRVATLHVTKYWFIQICRFIPRPAVPPLGNGGSSREGYHKSSSSVKSPPIEQTHRHKAFTASHSGDGIDAAFPICFYQRWSDSCGSLPVYIWNSLSFLPLWEFNSSVLQSLHQTGLQFLRFQCLYLSFN